MNTHTCNDSRIIDEDINNLHDEQREDRLLHYFKLESSFSFPEKCLLDCDRYCKRDYPFVYSKIKNGFFIWTVLCLTSKERVNAEQLYNKREWPSWNNILDKLCTHLITRKQWLRWSNNEIVRTLWKTWAKTRCYFW